jgi:hypothetical protein
MISDQKYDELLHQHQGIYLYLVEKVLVNYLVLLDKFKVVLAEKYHKGELIGDVLLLIETRRYIK